ncbi:hypothetical protein [Candidatus Enterovibrio altilux]|uniref:Mobile element protein n=1 Tax=Candidatus Enterovibrio altilux TaxID=1927128 RepID=A0A291B8G6_9GAMM|nr:hypothetical protein [Candidatus Enterovibrio luxaltus]ATF09299.1 hypothetical protein BTN50_0788 [Candidatus Enterovibrio luxaltus]
MEDLIHFIFKFTRLPLSCPYYACISKRVNMVNIVFKMVVFLIRVQIAAPNIVHY